MVRVRVRDRIMVKVMVRVVDRDRVMALVMVSDRVIVRIRIVIIHGNG